MSMLRRGLVLMLAAMAPVGAAAAQQSAIGENQWYVGAQGGVLIFETPTQTRGAIPTGGGHLLVTLKRTALLVQVEEGFGNDETSSYTDPTSATGSRQVAFNDIRRYSATLLAFPLKRAFQPYLGVGFGIMHVVNPQPLGTVSAAEFDFHQDVANRFGSFGFGSFLGGVQFRLGRLAGFAQYQITTGQGRESFFDNNSGNNFSGRLFSGPTHTFSGGIRVGLGGARAGVGSY